jgi:hypothetical protein
MLTAAASAWRPQPIVGPYRVLCGVDTDERKHTRRTPTRCHRAPRHE